MSEELVVLDYWASPYVARVKIALEEKGITNYECRHEDQIIGGKSSLLLEMNPVYKKVPVLIHNGKPICESLLIVEYIDEVFKRKSSTLMPANPYDRARARFWADYNDTMFPKFLPKLWTQKSEIKQEEQKDFINFLKLLEGELGEKPYFGGNIFGYSDIALIPMYIWLYSYEKVTKLNIQAECPKLIAWANKCLQRDTIKKLLPSELDIYNYVLELKKRFAID